MPPTENKHRRELLMKIDAERVRSMRDSEWTLVDHSSEHDFCLLTMDWLYRCGVMPGSDAMATITKRHEQAA